MEPTPESPTRSTEMETCADGVSLFFVTLEGVGLEKWREVFLHFNGPEDNKVCRKGAK